VITDGYSFQKKQIRSSISKLQKNYKHHSRSYKETKKVAINTDDRDSKVTDDIGVTSYEALGHVPPWSLRMYTNLAIYICVQLYFIFTLMGSAFTSSRQPVNATHFCVPATNSQSLKLA